MVHNILPGRERFKKILYLFLISPNCIVCLKGPAGDETYLDGRTNMCCMSVGINICSWKIIKMISISLWKWSHSWSAHPTNQILNRESLSHYPMENCKEEIRLVGAIFFFFTISPLGNDSGIAVQNLMYGMSRVQSFTQRNGYYFNIYYLQKL